MQKDANKYRKMQKNIEKHRKAQKNVKNMGKQRAVLGVTVGLRAWVDALTRTCAVRGSVN